jgi:hypothetical protein
MIRPGQLTINFKFLPISSIFFRNHWSLMVASLPPTMFEEATAPDDRM